MLVLALIVAGCGKSKEQINSESELDEEVATLQKDLESNISGISELQAQLDKTLKSHDELKKKFAKLTKNHNANDIADARQGLEAAKHDAEAAIAGLVAYDKEAKHDEVMQTLNKNKESLTSAKEKMMGAINAANLAIGNHEIFKEQLTKRRR